MLKSDLALFLSLLLIEGCDPPTYTLRLRNDSDHLIDCYYSFGWDKQGSIYPDTLIMEEMEPLTRGIQPGGRYIYNSSNEWAYVFSRFPRDTISIYIFHTDTVNKFSWDTIRSQYKVLKRYDLSYDDVEKMNFEIPYPPNEDMKNVKMWPGFVEQNLVQDK
jgi:hypothetical protein